MSCVWKVDEMLVKPQEAGQTDVVVTVKFSCSATSGDKTAAYRGNMGFTAPGDPFTPYDQLTEAQVLNWCYSRGVNKTQTESNVMADLDALVNPPIVPMPLPWA